MTILELYIKYSHNGHMSLEQFESAIREHSEKIIDEFDKIDDCWCTQKQDIFYKLRNDFILHGN